MSKEYRQQPDAERQQIDKANSAKLMESGNGDAASIQISGELAASPFLLHPYFFTAPVCLTASWDSSASSSRTSIGRLR
jgi:hypothetical protein